MKRLFQLLMGLSLFMLFAMSCENTASVNDTRAPKEKLQGNWEVVKANGALDDINIGTEYLFEGNKMATSNGFEISGELLATDSTILWKLETMEMNYSYHFDGNQLIIEPLNSGQVLTLTRK